MSQVKFVVTIFLVTLLAAKGRGAVNQVNLNANETVQCINSPNFPMNYDPNLDCLWVITAPNHCVVSLNITSLKIEGNFADNFFVKDGGLAGDMILYNAFSGTLGDGVSSKLLKSSGAVMRVEFNSDISVEFTGFKAEYKECCNTTAGWSDWGPWGECSECCGNGTQTRMRNCTNPPPSGMGDDCVGTPTETRNCNKHPCPVNCTGLPFTQDSPYEQDCRRFYRCDSDILTCPVCEKRNGLQLWFDPRIKRCNNPCAVNCTTACGIKPIAKTAKNRIVGGIPSPENGWPWQALLFQNNRLCAGTLIHPYWVLTAAHCFHPDNTTFTQVRLGFHFLSGTVGTEQIIDIEKVIIHPNFSQPVLYAQDVALIKLAQPAKLNNAVGLACLPTEEVKALEIGKTCYITGWGTTQFGGAISNVLMQAAVPIQSNIECNETYSGAVHESMLCAGLVNGGVDACQGDSGGPLVCEHHGKYYVEGITSWGRGCALPNFFGVYARVRVLINWIWYIIYKILK